MKKCLKCGFENDDSNLFCGKCGEKFTNNIAKCAKCNCEFDSSLSFCPQCGVRKNGKNVFRILLISAVVLIAIVLLCAAIFANISKIQNKDSSADLKIQNSTQIDETQGPVQIVLDPLDFCSVSFSGYSGYGSGDFEVDEEAIEFLLEDDKYNLSNQTRLEAKNILSGIKGEVKSNTLKNGDNISINLGYDADKLNEIGISLNSDQIKFKVDNLKDLIVIDPFDKAQLQISGWSGYATVDELDFEESPYYEILSLYTTPIFVGQYSNQNGKIKSGDIITVKLDYDKRELAEMGYSFSRDSTQFFISCNQPVTSFDESLCNNIKKILLTEAENICKEFPQIDAQITELNPYAFVYLPSIEEIYVYNEGSPNNFTKARAVGIYTSENEKGEPRVLTVYITNIYIQPDGSIAYTVYPHDTGKYTAIYDLCYLLSNEEPEESYKMWISEFDYYVPGLVVSQLGNDNVIKNVSHKTVVHADERAGFFSLDEIFQSVNEASSIIASYAVKDSTFLFYYPECKNMDKDEVAQNLKDGKYTDCWYISGGRLIGAVAGERHEVQVISVPYGDFESLSSRVVFY